MYMRSKNIEIGQQARVCESDLFQTAKILKDMDQMLKNRIKLNVET